MKSHPYLLTSTLIALALPALPSLAQSNYEPYTFTTLAGKNPDSPDGTGSDARFGSSNDGGPSGVAMDIAGNLYVADSHAIRIVSAAGVVTTLAGMAGRYGLGGNADGTGSAARFTAASGVAVDKVGNVYVTDFNTLRKVTPTGVVTTLAGLPPQYDNRGDLVAGGSGSADGTGSDARFYHPQGVAVDSAGNVYVADTYNWTIRKVTPEGVVTTLAGLAGVGGSADGTGSDAQFRPQGVAVDSAGNVYVADGGNGTIRKVTPEGKVTTLAGQAGSYGSADGLGNVARFNFPTGVAVDGAGNVYVADWGNKTIRKVTPAGEVTTLAGLAGSFGSADGTGNVARFSQPQGVAVDRAGRVYVADIGNRTLRQVTPAGVVTTLAGVADSDSSADGAGSVARFSQPKGMTVDTAGIVYVADTGSHTIRKVTPAGMVTTLAGLAGSSGSADGQVSGARFNQPQGVAVDSAGNVYVADSDNFTIRKVTPAGLVTTMVGLAGMHGSADGTGSSARFGRQPVVGTGPKGVAVDSAGNVYVADNGNSAIRKVTPAGVVTTLAGLAGYPGSADGTGSIARFYWPSGVAVDNAGNVYVADSSSIYTSHNLTIRKVTPAGLVTTLAGLAGSPGGTDGTGSNARFGDPTGVAVDSAGNVYVADSGNGTIRKVTSTGVVTTLAGLARNSGSADGTGSDARFAVDVYGYESGLGVAVDGAGFLYVADTVNATIRKGFPALMILKSGFDGRKFIFNLTGQVGRAVGLETSTDLVSWLPLGTASFLISQITMTDPDASDFARRFYRVFYRGIPSAE